MKPQEKMLPVIPGAWYLRREGLLPSPLIFLVRQAASEEIEALCPDPWRVVR